MIRAVTETTFSTVVECEQEAFSRERICSSPPPHLNEKMMMWMRDWTLWLLETSISNSLSWASFDDKDKCNAFAICESFPPESNFEDQTNASDASRAVEHLLTGISGF